MTVSEFTTVSKHWIDMEDIARLIESVPTHFVAKWERNGFQFQVDCLFQDLEKSVWYGHDPVTTNYIDCLLGRDTRKFIHCYDRYVMTSAKWESVKAQYDLYYDRVSQ